MSQLMLRALRSRCFVPRAKLLCQQAQSNALYKGYRYNTNKTLLCGTHIRSLSQSATADQYHGAVATQTTDIVDSSSDLFASKNKEMIRFSDARESLESLHYIQAGQSITEQLSVMQACLINGDPERAQRMLAGLYKLYPESMKEAVDVGVHNEILSGLINMSPRPLTTEALLWYDQMDREYHTKPNASTFAILISGFMRSKLRNVAMVLIQELLRCGHNFQSLLLSPYITDSDIDTIKQVAHDMLNSDAKNNAIATQLLEAVNDAEIELENITGESVEQAEIKGTDPKEGKAKTDTDLISTGAVGIQQLKEVLKSLDIEGLEGYNMQLKLEQDTYEAALERYREINKQRGDPLLSSDVGHLKKLSAIWLPQLETLIEEEQIRCNHALEENNDRIRSQYGRYLLLLDPPKLATITILEVLRLNASDTKSYTSDEAHRIDGHKTTRIVTAISNAIQNEVRLEQMKKRTNRHIFGKNLSIAKMASSGKLFNMTVRRAKAKEVQARDRETWLDNWALSTKTRIGSLLLSMLIETARVPKNISDIDNGIIDKDNPPAFTHNTVMHKGRRLGIISPHNNLRQLFREDSLAGVMNARSLPMLVPPRPWLTYNSGGYLSENEPCMRTKRGSEQLRYLKKASNEDRISTLLAGLDSLGLTRWSINRPVFEAVRKVWNSGISLAEIPPASYNVPEPEKPSNFDTDNKAKLKFSYELRDWKNGKANQHSQRCDCNYKVEIAGAFLNHPMYFPHNMDFRGRAYPIPPHFNHLGNDLCRGLLLFYEGKPLGDNGIYWLKIHLANLYGKDKLSHDERLEFVATNIDNIMASADNPVPEEILNENYSGPRPWWLDSEDPWQTLAACIDLTAALRSPDPKEYVSHLHIHQDGTCNGLQHYAAMGRDRNGAREVNLLPSERPQDVYTGILKIVQRLINEDAEQGNESAKLLQGKLTRKIVKQTVMTNVYGVTLIGAKEQILSRLRELKNDKGEPLFDVLIVSKLAMYVANKIFSSLGEMFTQAQQMQNWLNDSAHRIAKSMPTTALATWKQSLVDSKEAKAKLRSILKIAKDNNKIVDSKTVLGLRPDLGPGSTRRKRLDALATKPMTTVIWTTPLGLTVVQPYRKGATRQIKTSLQSITISDEHMPSPVNSQKQKTAFPPNFVHSLDASHMILSAIECKKAGLVFASVHDSYWTHACDIDKMNGILREQFVMLHDRPILDDLKAEFEERYSDHKMPVKRWEYVPSASTNHTNKAEKKTAKETKADLAKAYEEAVETTLAEEHLRSCDGDDAVDHPDDINVSQDGSSADANAASVVTEPIKMIDLKTIEFVDPKSDLIGALRQVDQIAHTIKTLKAQKEEEISNIKKEHKVQNRLLKKESAAAGESPKAWSEKSKKRKQELHHKLNEVENKYTVSLAQPKIIIDPSKKPEVYSQIKDMITSGQLSGRLIKRVEWVDIEFDDTPTHGDFEISEVLKSPYFFS